MTAPNTGSTAAATAAAAGLAAARAKYREERDKRLRADGNAQYARLSGQLGDGPRDPHLPVAAREPVHDDVTVALVGAGFAGLLTAARLVEAGIADVRLVDKAGDVGGTWYWNRYPGAQCDTASMVYLPLLEETGHVPTEKYAHGPEIRAHCGDVAEKYGLRENALFHTEVTDLAWDEGAKRWRVRTDRGDDFTARFVCLGIGPLHVAKLPAIPGIGEFRGRAFHTSRWDYAYTGGDAEGAPLTGLADKRVAVIGTGATAVQCVPRLAADCAELFVFQRTPSSVDVRANAPIDPDWFASVATPGWQRRWLENFAANQTGVGVLDDDLVMDGWTDLSRRIRSKLAALPAEERTLEGMLAAYEETDFQKMESIRTRVEEVVADPATAAGLKAWYRQLCKRPCFHDEYLDAYNRPNVHLVHTDGRGVERIAPDAVVVDGTAYPVDCIVFASGFEVGTDWVGRAGFQVAGVGGRTLSQAWAEGMRSLHGVHVHGFPNAFFVQPTQGANLISNVPHNLADAALSIAQVVAATVARGADTVEVSEQAEADWVALLRTAPARMIGSPDCTPGYYNNEGREPEPSMQLQVGHPQGATAYFAYIDGWRRSGEYAGLEFS